MQPSPANKPSLFSYVLLFLSRLLKSIWLFFPSLFFLGLTIFCFWTLGQGKDLIISFTESETTKVLFFVAIAFWLYVSWYSSRIVSYQKKFMQECYIRQCAPQQLNPPEAAKFELTAVFLDRFPRMIGFSCILIIELALFQIPLFFKKPLTTGWALVIWIAALFILGWVDRRLIKFCQDGHPNTEKNKRIVRKLFWYSISLFLAVLIGMMFWWKNSNISVSILIIMLLWLLIIFLFYLNYRRNDVQDKTRQDALRLKKDSWIDSKLKKIMAFVNIPAGEVGYFKWFTIISLAGFIIYILVIRSLDIAMAAGPFPFVIGAFAVLLGFGNIITVLSVKTRVNLHFVVFLTAAFFSSSENHSIRTFGVKENNIAPAIYKDRQDIYEYYTRWIESHPEIDSAKGSYPVYFVLANGGASRSAYWVASVLGRLEDSSLAGNNRFSKHVFCLSGTSGGGVGVAAFYALLKNAERAPALQPQFENSAKYFLEQDFLTYTLARMLGPDYFKYIMHISPWGDRAAALEYSFENCADTGYYKLRFDSTYFNECVARRNQTSSLPVLCINTTRVQDGTPGVLSSIRLQRDVFNNRIDVVDLLNDTCTIKLSTASIMGARFPYVSPAGRIDQQTKVKDSISPHYFVDGGYFDNSGAGVVQEMIRAIGKITDTTRNMLVKQRAKKLRLVVLHITNSPQGDALLKNVTPLNNDLAAPVLTILGAYDMQTTVNDRRLDKFLADVNSSKDTGTIRSAVYYPIHLYTGPGERSDSSSRGPYAMNWFISANVRDRMDIRLNKQPKLQQLIRGYIP
jgi:predicted acylesterase/phospholipase RssA